MPSQDFVYKFRPVINEKKAIYSSVQLLCLKCSCDRTLLTRWMTTVASILSIANDEFELLLQKFHLCLKFKFIVKQSGYSLAVQIGNEKFDNINVPIIVGTQLWFMCESLSSGSSIDITSYRQWKRENKEPKDIMCPICCFTQYIPLCCFFIDQKMFRLPTLASVDCRKFHIRRPGNLLNVFVGSVRIGEDNDEAKLLQPLMCVKEEIFKMRDLISNFSFYTVGKVFAKRIEIALAHIVSLDETSIKKRNNALAILNRMHKDFSFGNLTITVSRSTQFASAEMGGQLNETHQRSNEYQNVQLRKSDIESRKGFIKESSRYIQTPVNQPILTLFAPLHCVKLASVDLKTKSHQILQSANCAYFDKIHTVDNKNVGCHLEVLPGVKFVQYNDTQLMCNDLECNYTRKLNHSWRNEAANVVQSCKSVSLNKGGNSNESEYGFDDINLTGYLNDISSFGENSDSSIADNNDVACSTVNVSCVQSTNIYSDIAEMKIHLPTVDSVSRLKQRFGDVCRKHANSGSECIVYFPDISYEQLKMSIEAVEELLRQHEYPISLYYWPTNHVCIVYSSSSCCDIVDERFSLTPLTRECLLNEFPDRWYERLSPNIAGNVPIFGVLGHQFMLLNHDSTSKLVPGFAGVRHALGLPVSCKVPIDVPRGRYLVYPQGDLENQDSIVCSSQKLMVVVAAFRSHGVEDGIIVNKEARDKGFGLVLNECLQAQLMVTFSGPELIIALPKADSNMLDIIFKHDTDSLKKLAVNVTVKVPEKIRHQAVQQNTFLCDVLGISSYNSFAIDIKVVSYQSASRIYFHRYYNVGDSTSRDYRMLFDSVTIRTAGKPQNCNVFICLNFTELRPLELGDKFSTIDGQKATVVALLPAVDMPFIGGKGEFPPIPDIILNISSSKRQTLGLNLSGVCMSAKLADTDIVDLNAFRGDHSVKHSKELQRLLRNCEQSGIVGRVPLFDGRTGLFMGYGDLYCLTMFRYEQDGSKTVFYTHWDEENRTPNGDFQEKGRGRKGGSKYSQTETVCLLNQGGPPAYQKQLLQTGEPRTNFNRNTSIFPQSFISAVMSCNIHNLNIQPIMKK